MRFKGFVSDMDGVVADTEELWFEGTKAFLKRYGFSISREEYGVLVGTPEHEDAKLFKGRYGIPLTEHEILVERRASVLEALSKDILVNDSYLDLLDLLGNNGVKIALASGSPRTIIDAVMNATGLGHRYIVTVSAEEVGSKAAAYRRAAERMGLKPSDCFALEDSPSGALAAKEAGFYCVVIPSKLLKDADFSFADEVHLSIPEFLNNGEVWS